MGRLATEDINRLIGEFTDQQESWESDPQRFDWSRLEALARDGAQAYNEGSGPSFHALALDGVEHSEFHERFLGFLLDAGFDPFKLAAPGTGVAPVPVIDHASLAEAAETNPSSARMRDVLLKLARDRFASKADAAAQPPLPSDAMQVLAACAESIPEDLLDCIAPGLAPRRTTPARRSLPNPTEGYLSPAEAAAESGQARYG